MQRRLVLLTLAVSVAATVAGAVAAIPAYGVEAGANGKLAFVADEAGKPQVFTIKPDGTGLTRLTNRPNGAGNTDSHGHLTPRVCSWS